MEWLSKIFHKCEVLFDNSVEYAHSNPKAGFLIVILLLSVWLLGIILDWKWTYLRPGSWGGNFFLDLLGPTTFRFWVGVILVIGIVASAYLYFKLK